jgi:hypothetical protein
MMRTKTTTTKNKTTMQATMVGNGDEVFEARDDEAEK